MLLAAGLGTRMRPLTESRPKPLIVAGGKTLLDHNLDQLADAGITRVVVNVHYLADQIEAHCASRHDLEIIISDERAALLDSGGGIRNALAHLGPAPFFSLNADTIWVNGPRSNLVRMAEFYDPARMDILLLVAPTVTTIGWGNRRLEFSNAGLRGRFPDGSGWPPQSPGKARQCAFCLLWRGDPAACPVRGAPRDLLAQPFV